MASALLLFTVQYSLFTVHYSLFTKLSYRAAREKSKKIMYHDLT